jgi:hypothetical protein
MSGVVGYLISVLLAVGGFMALRSSNDLKRKMGAGTLVLAVLVLPMLWHLEFAFASSHAALVVLATLWIPLLVFGKSLTSGSESLEAKGHWATRLIGWVWPLVVVQDILLWLGFQGFFVRLGVNQPLVLVAEIIAQAVVGTLVLYLLSGDGRPRLGYIKQVFVAWSSAMVTMGLGISLGLSGPWFGFYSHAAESGALVVDQQLAAAIFVILGGAPWFIVGALRLKLFLDIDEKEDKGRIPNVPGVRIGRSVRGIRR